MSTTHTGSILQAIYASKTHTKECVDVLLLDYPPMKESLINLIKRSDVIHQWDQVIDFSVPMTDQTNKKPSLKKRLIRKLKTQPLIKNIYDELLTRHLVKQKEAHTKKLKEELKKHPQHIVKLHVLTKTGLNECLFDLFPKAEINYFEHGIGDYMYYEQQSIRAGNFFCLFSKEFSAYLSKTNKDLSDSVFGYIEGNEFSESIDKLVYKGIIKLDSASDELVGDLVFILMENVEMYEVDSNFWTDYIDMCLKNIPNPSEFTFVIKPHHMQSFDAIERTTSYFSKKGLKYLLLTNNHFMHMGAEIVFYFFAKRTKYVFSLFSSSVYYFTKLYPSKEIKYYHGYKLFARYTNKSPKQFTDIYKGLGPIITNVVSKECLEL